MANSKDFNDFDDSFKPTEEAQVIAEVIESNGYNTLFKITKVLEGNPSIKNEEFSIDNHAHELSITPGSEEDEFYPSKYVATLEVTEDTFTPHISCKEIYEKNNF